MISIKRFSAELSSEWNEFVNKSKNSHFMFYREYMDYHSDRFIDFSLMFYDDKNRLIALLPANLNKRIFYSHQGLTFGGLLMSSTSNTLEVHQIFLSALNYLNNTGLVDSIIYKRVPDFYHKYLSQEDLYALFLLNSKLIRRDVSSLIDLKQILKYSKGREGSVKQAQKNSITVVEENNLSAFWHLLENVLSIQHSIKPVHSLPEIELLRERFPENIKCYVALLDDELLAGSVVYISDNVVHTQYLANSEKGRSLSALDFLIDYLIKNISKNKRYFNFGISTENNGYALNNGLIAYKEGFGARAFTQDFYEINMSVV